MKNIQTANSVEENPIISALTILSEAQLQDLFDNTSDLIQSVSPAGHFLFVNRAWQEALGYSAKEVAALNIDDILPAETQAYYRDLLQQIMTGNHTGLFETSLQAKGGHVLTVKGHISLLMEEGRPTAIRSIFRRVPELKTPEAKTLLLSKNPAYKTSRHKSELLGNEKRYKDLVASIPGAVFEFRVDTAGTYSLLFISEGIARLIGLSSAECMTDVECMSRRIPTEAMPALKASIDISLKRLSPWLHAFPIYTPLGNKWLRGHSLPFRKEDGSTHWQGVLFDITSQKQAEDALGRTEQMFHAITEMAPVGIFQADKNGHCCYANEHWCHIAGINSHEASGNGWITAIHPDDRKQVADEWLHAVKNRQRFKSVYRFQTKERKITWVSSQAQVKTGSNGEVNGYVGTVTDITAHKEMEASLQTLNNRLNFLLSSSPAIIYTCKNTPPYETTFVSTNIAKILGYTAEEFLADSDFWLDHIHSEDRDQVLSGLADLFAHGNSTHEYRFKHKDGSWRWMRDELRIVSNPIEKTQELIGYFIDITESRLKDNALAEAHNLLKTVIDTVPVRIFWKDKKSRFLGCNMAVVKDAGKTSPDDLIGKTDYQFGWKNQAESYQRDDLEVMRTGIAKLDYEEPQTTPDGKTIWLKTSKAPLRNKNNEIIGVLGIYDDITEQKKALETMVLANTVYESSSEAIMITDHHNQIIQVNSTFTHMTGYELGEIIGKNPRIFQSGFHNRQFYKEMWQSLKEKSHWQGEIWDRRKDGSIHAKWINISIIRHPDGRIKYHVAQFSDITEKKQKEELILKQANYDELTGLPNRNLFKDRLQQEIKKTQRNKQSLSLLFLDLDHFKDINDTFGHDKGDELLMEVAHRIITCVRQTDTVARLGGDEFAVILPELFIETHIEMIAHKIIRELNKPFEFKNDPAKHHISTSIGIAVFPKDGSDMESLMKHADQAMYAAKEERNRFSFFTPSMQQAAKNKMTLTHNLRQALADNQLEVYYQPILDFSKDRIIKVEALLRWNHPEHGMISPNVFIPLAEQSSLILEISEWALNQSITHIKQWFIKFGHIIQVNVNMSPVQFRQNNKLNWAEKLAQTGLPGNSINVEITEGLLLKDSPFVKKQLLEFRNNGIEVSIDDFGTGFSSLSYLKKFDIDFLKIDRSFVAHLTENDTDRALVEAIIVMAHKLDIKTIAEGVETKEQENLLVAFGCDYAQGFLYSPPLSVTDLEKLIVKKRLITSRTEPTRSNSDC